MKMLIIFGELSKKFLMFLVLKLENPLDRS